MSEVAEDIDGTDGTSTGSTTSNTNTYTNADACSFFESTDEYPSELYTSVAAYLNAVTDETTSSVQNAINNNSSLVTSTSSSSMSIQTTSTNSPFERLNGENILQYTSSST